MTIALSTRSRQTGAYLLEALVGILIFALGVLGIVGLQAASLRTSTDSSVRAEAVFAASQLVGQMAADKYISLVGNYASVTAGPTYANWATDLKTTQGGAWFQDPQVNFGDARCGAAPDVFSVTVFIEIFWQSPDGDTVNPDCNGTKCHTYSTCATIAMNYNK